MSAVTLQVFLQNLASIRKTWPSHGWSWDSRAGCVASTFRSDLSQKARTSILALLPTELTELTLRGANASVRELAQRHGGVRAGQSLFFTPLVGGLIGYGLWWPWEEGSTISMRVGVEGGGDMTLQLCDAMSIDP